MANSQPTRIYLANGRGVALIDAEDATRVPLAGWHLHPMGYAARHTAMVDGKRTLVLLHRVVMGATRGTDIDHINHEKLDCRRSNLRPATKSQNMQNRRGAQRNNHTTGIRGVMNYETKTQGIKFRAAIQLRPGRNITKYGFGSASEAEAFVIELRRRHFTHSQERA